MRCPACRAPAIEIDAACGQCGFSLEAADRTFGIAPALERPITDFENVLGAMARRGVLKVIGEVERRFPQLRLAVVLMDVPDRSPLGAFAFWLFNRGQLSSALEKGGENRLVMLLIDTHTNHAAAMPGYGLEPLLKESQLQNCLEVASPALQHGRHGQAIEAFARELGRQLGELCQLLPRQFGLTDDARWVDASAPGEELVGTGETLY